MPIIRRSQGWQLALFAAATLLVPELSEAKGIRDANFRNFTYSSSVCGFARKKRVSVKKGRFKSRRGFLLTVDSVTYGDSDGDGQEEALVVVTCRTKQAVTGTGRLYEWGRSRNPKKKGLSPQLIASFTGEGKIASANFTDQGIEALRSNGATELWAWSLALRSSTPGSETQGNTQAATPPTHPLLDWVAWEGSAPSEAAQGGRENGRPLAICRAPHRGGTHPGRVVQRRCHFGYGGEEIVAESFSILVDRGRGRWVEAPGGRVAEDAVIGGREGGRDFPVCRVRFKGGVQPGKVVAGRCNVGWGGDEFALSGFEVLAIGPHWIRGGGTLPQDIAIGGRDRRKPLPICRAAHRRGMHPGKVVAGRCNFGWGGREIVSSDYEVLVDHQQGRWVEAPEGNLPPDAFVGGHEAGRFLAVCRANHQGGVHPGKVVGGNCNIGWGGDEVVARDFEVLVMGRP